MNNLFDVKGRKAIVTGAASGLAHGMAEGLLEAGAEVVVFDISSTTEAAVNDWREQGYTAHAVVGNLGDRDELIRMFNKAMDILAGQVDILVTAAGIQRRHPSEEFPMEDWDAVIAINLTSVFQLCQLAGNVMLKQGHGKIVNIASMNSFFGGQTIPAYSASKGGIAQLTRALANDWAYKGINVNALAPGYMATKMNEALLDPNNPRFQTISERIPAHRWGTPNDMKGPVLFLASAASDYLNGAIIPVDGGYLSK